MHTRLPALVIGGIMLMLSSIVVVYSYYYASTYEAAADETSYASLLNVKRALEERLAAIVVAVSTAMETCSYGGDSAREADERRKCLAKWLDDVAGLTRIQSADLQSMIPVRLEPFATTDHLSAGIYVSTDARHLILALCRQGECVSTRAMSRYALDLPGLALEVPVAAKFNALLLADSRGSVLVGWNVPTQVLTRGIGGIASHRDDPDPGLSDPWYAYRAPLVVPFVIATGEEDARGSVHLVVLRDRAPVSPMQGVPQSPLRWLFFAICLAPGLLPLVSLAVLRRTERVRWWDLRLLAVSACLMCAIAIYLYRQIQFSGRLDDLLQHQAEIALGEFERVVFAKVREAHSLAGALRNKTPDSEGCVGTQRFDPIVPAGFSLFNTKGEITSRFRSDPSTIKRFCRLQRPTRDFSDRQYFRTIIRDHRPAAVDIVQSRLSGREDLLVAIGTTCPPATSRDGERCVAAVSIPLFPGGMIMPPGVELALATNDRVLLHSEANRDRVARLLELTTGARKGWCDGASVLPTLVEDGDRRYVVKRGRSSLGTLGGQAIDVCALAIVDPTELDAIQTDAAFGWASWMLLYAVCLAFVAAGAIATGMVSERELAPVAGSGRDYRKGALSLFVLGAGIWWLMSLLRLGGLAEGMIVSAACLVVAYRFARVPVGRPPARPDPMWLASYAALVGITVIVVAGYGSWRIADDAQKSALERWVGSQTRAMTHKQEEALRLLREGGGARFSAIDRERLKPILEDPGGKKIDLVYRTCPTALCDPPEPEGQLPGPREAPGTNGDPNVASRTAGAGSRWTRDFAFVAGLWLVMTLAAMAVVRHLFPSLGGAPGSQAPSRKSGAQVRFYSYSLRRRTTQAERAKVVTVDAARPIREEAFGRGESTTVKLSVVGVERAWSSGTKRRALFDALARFERSTSVHEVTLVTTRAASDLLGELQNRLSSRDDGSAGDQRELREWAQVFATMREEVTLDAEVDRPSSPGEQAAEDGALDWARWARWPLEERFTLVQVLDEGMINPRRRAAGDALVKKGIVRSLPRLEVLAAPQLRAFDGIKSLRSATARWEGRSGSRIRGGLQILFWGAMVVGVIAVQRILPQQHYGVVVALASAVMAAAQISSVAQKAFGWFPARAG